MATVKEVQIGNYQISADGQVSNWADTVAGQLANKVDQIGRLMIMAIKKENPY